MLLTPQLPQVHTPNCFGFLVRTGRCALTASGEESHLRFRPWIGRSAEEAADELGILELGEERMRSRGPKECEILEETRTLEKDGERKLLRLTLEQTRSGSFDHTTNHCLDHM